MCAEQRLGVGEVKVNTARPSRMQIQGDRIIEAFGHFEGINGPIGIAGEDHNDNPHQVLLWRVLEVNFTAP